MPTGRRYKYPECRSRMPGHRWDRYAGTDWVPTHGFGEEERCDRCGTVRRAVVDINGNKSSWMYEYPFDYKTDLTNGEMRLMVIKSKVVPLRRRGNIA